MRALTFAAKRAIASGVAAAAILDHRGKVVALAGELDPHEARAIVAHATHQLDRAHARLLDGELLATSIAGRDARIGIAGGSVFFVIVLPSDPAAMSLVALDELRADIEQIIHDAKTSFDDALPPPSSAPGGSSSGPAELPLVELGVTVPRRRPN
jgi:hypothetical protein